MKQQKKFLKLSYVKKVFMFLGFYLWAVDWPHIYFESKPKRVVDLSEFGGAIVPKGSEPQIRKILEKYGITRLKTYETDVERTAARKAFQDLMFSIGLPATVAGSIIYGEEDQSV